jgi:uncharacterized protein YecE (DUF72 family)
MRFLVGTSGYSYPQWKGAFYPPKLPQKEMLAYYAQQFSAVEINNSFNKLPSENVVESWALQTPSTFRFSLKAPQAITHRKRLANAEIATDQFLAVASRLKQQMAPLLFQLPPNFQKNALRLESFLGFINGRVRLAFEFRHPSWFDTEVFDCLRAHSCALCIADTDDPLCTDVVSTAPWGYVRLRREVYTNQDLDEWVKRLKSQKWDETYVFFKHEDTGTGPKYASSFLELAGPPSQS